MVMVIGIGHAIMALRWRIFLLSPASATCLNFFSLKLSVGQILKEAPWVDPDLDRFLLLWDYLALVVKGSY